VLGYRDTRCRDLQICKDVQSIIFLPSSASREDRAGIAVAIVVDLYRKRRKEEGKARRPLNYGWDLRTESFS
jgi:hypothetical protein